MPQPRTSMPVAPRAVHFGMSGRFGAVVGKPAPEVRPTTRLALVNKQEGLVAHLSAMTVLHGSLGALLALMYTHLCFTFTLMGSRCCDDLLHRKVALAAWKTLKNPLGAMAVGTASAYASPIVPACPRVLDLLIAEAWDSTPEPQYMCRLRLQTWGGRTRPLGPSMLRS